MNDLKYFFIGLLTIIFVILLSTCVLDHFSLKMLIFCFLLCSNIKNISPWSPINTTHSFPFLCFVFRYFWHLFKFIPLFLYGFSLSVKFIKAFLDPKIYKYYSCRCYYCFLCGLHFLYLFFMKSGNILRSGKYVSKDHVVFYWIQFFTCNSLLQAIK